MASEKEKQDWKFNNCWFDKKRKFLFGRNNEPVLLEALKFPLLTTVHALNHWFTDKMIAFRNQYWWETLIRPQKVPISLSHCLKYKPGKSVCIAPRHFKLPNGPFKFWQIDFIQLSPSHGGYKYASVMVCMFSHWTEAFPCRQATASSVVKVLFGKDYVYLRNSTQTS